LNDGELERAAELWIADYVQAEHLRRTRDWVVTLDPAAGEQLRVAALTHDIERREPGSPDPWQHDWGDPRYVLEHSARSARMVAAWLEARDADREYIAAVERLILHHEIGGYPEADLLQAADSLSFLEVNRERPRKWVEEGRCDVASAQAKLDLMRDRIAVAAARGPAEALHAAASSTLAAAPLHPASLSENGPAEGDKRRRPGVHRHP
jgi:hypothetical protein